MFDKDLFLSLCEKYDVELSETATRPMIREGIDVHAITDDDVNRIFSPYEVLKIQQEGHESVNNPPPMTALLS